MKAFDELCRARDELMDILLRSPPNDDFGYKLAQYLVNGRNQEDMPMKLVAAQEAVMAALDDRR